MGIIEWMKNTMPLKEFLQNALEEKERKNYFNAASWQIDWLSKFDCNYKVMYKYIIYCSGNLQIMNTLGTEGIVSFTGGCPLSLKVLALYWCIGGKTIVGNFCWI